MTSVAATVRSRAHSGTSRCENCVIRHSSLCSVLSRNDLDGLERVCSHRQIKAGQSVFAEGEHATFVFGVISGTLRLCKLLSNGRRQITGFPSPGDFLGFSTDGKFPNSAEAVTDATLCQLKTVRLERLYEEIPQLRIHLLEISQARLAEAQQQILLLGTKTPLEKVASFILWISDGNSERASSDGTIDLPMNRTDIADYLGLTIETVSRRFSDLKSKGVIGGSNARQVKIKNKSRLQAIAQVDCRPSKVTVSVHV